MDALHIEDSDREQITKNLQKLDHFSESGSADEKSDENTASRSNSRHSSTNVTNFDDCPSTRKRTSQNDESKGFETQTKSNGTSSMSSEESMDDKSDPQQKAEEFESLNTSISRPQDPENGSQDCPSPKKGSGPTNLLSLIPAMKSPTESVSVNTTTSIPVQPNVQDGPKENILSNPPNPEDSAVPKTIYPTVSSLMLSRSSIDLLNRENDSFPTVTNPIVIDASYRSKYQGTAPGRGRGRLAKKSKTQISLVAKEPTNEVVPLDTVQYTEEGKKIKPGTMRPTRTKELPPPIALQKSVPYFIIIVSVVEVALMVWEIVINGGFAPPAQNPMFGPSADTLLVVGAEYDEYILNRGEWWRFITAIFLHAGLIHIGFNLLAQIPVGIKLERIHGTFRIFVIYMLSGVFGNILSAIFLPYIVSLGASGAIFGFFGVLLVDLIKNWKRVPKPKRTLGILIGAIVFSFLLGLLPGINNFAHFGGFIMGILSSIVFIPAMHIGEFNKKKRALQVGLVLPIIIILFVGLLIVVYMAPIESQWCPWCKYLSCLPVFNCGP
jgi:membrane associated rhomboid family serine protease